MRQSAGGGAGRVGGVSVTRDEYGYGMLRIMRRWIDQCRAEATALAAELAPTCRHPDDLRTTFTWYSGTGRIRREVMPQCTVCGQVYRDSWQQKPQRGEEDD